MSKRLFIIHGWSGYPEEGWLPWLKGELEKQGWLVFVPQMPNAQEPRIEAWVKAINREVREIDSETYFIGHSMGCQAIIRFLEREESLLLSGGAIFVAGFLDSLTNIGNSDLEVSAVKEWLKTPIDFELIRRRLKKSIAIFSDNDPFVPLSNQFSFKRELNSSIIIQNDAQHFSGSTGAVELPIVKELVLSLAE